MKILLICKDTVGKQMAGPGIRYFEMAKMLSKDHEITLAAPRPVNLKDKFSFKILAYDKTKETSALGKIVPSFDIVIAQFLKPSLLKKINQHRIKYIADLYDPLIIETLGHFKEQSTAIQAVNVDFQRYLTCLQIAYADLILCASDKQADYYLGLLSAVGRINPESYQKDNTFSKLLMTVPFGIEDFTSSNIKNDFIKKFIPDYQADDKVVLWAGGIWNWFDPLSAIKAINITKQINPRIKLLFMNGKHPNPDIPEMKMATEAVKLAEKLNLLSKQVYFTNSWIPYNDRHQLLDKSFLGISTHFDDIETRFSFRTRILDYIGHKLPIIATQGDSMSELIEKKNLGIVVDYENSQQIAAAILKLIDDGQLYSEQQENLAEVRAEFLWSSLLQPLSKFITANKFAKRAISSTEMRRLTNRFYRVAARRVFLTKGFNGVLNKLIGR